ncbi:hypothetical protein [uncultured Bacteroides sp.]|uniref:hypothetical protein n=1 Tax=uncultured Bacteroides sp. TaxID=162156 RepID=UPI002591CB3A|nr:hypothetical protein [uncultured Bacteroides sp.]
MSSRLVAVPGMTTSCSSGRQGQTLENRLLRLATGCSGSIRTTTAFLRCCRMRKRAALSMCPSVTCGSAADGIARFCIARWHMRKTGLAGRTGSARGTA